MVMVDIVMTYVVMAYVVVADTVMTYVGMAYVVVAYVVVTPYSHGLCSDGLCSYGLYSSRGLDLLLENLLHRLGHHMHVVGRWVVPGSRITIVAIGDHARAHARSRGPAVHLALGHMTGLCVRAGGPAGVRGSTALRWPR